MEWYIGNVKIDGRVVVAPMAGISDTTFRKICKSFGASLVVGEMVSDKALYFGNEKTLELLKMTDEERPISQQIFGSDVESFVEAAKLVEKYMHPDIIDINMGCPVPKVAIKNQAGSALLKNPAKVKEIVQAVCENVNIPVTVKMRSGWDEQSINAVEIAKIVEEAGAKAITIHGRTRSQGYSGKADLDIIKKVVEAVHIPVIGNGDITSCYEAKKMLDYTGCKAVMIGRGLLGNPWLIKECNDYLEKGLIPVKVSYKERLDMMKKHLENLCIDKSEIQAVLEIRTHFLHYLKAMPKNKEYKNLLCQAKSQKEIIDILDKYEEELA